MARITLTDIQNIIAEKNWKVVSDTYINLDTEMQFKCEMGHNIYAPWKRLRNNLICPTCAKNYTVVNNLEIKSKPRGAQRTLALDQASHVTGYAIFDDTKLIGSGTFETSAADEVNRIIEIKTWLLSMINNWKPDVIGIEGIQFQDKSGTRQMGVTVFETLAHLQGVIMVLCAENKIKYEVCPTNTWRHACGVKGTTRADRKRSMKLLVHEWYGIDVSDDIADAIGIGFYLCTKLNKYNKIDNWEI